MNLEILISFFDACVRRAGLLLLSSLLLLSRAHLGFAATSPATNGLEHGFAYRHEVVPDVPWSIHIVQIDRANTNFEFHTTLAKGSTIGLSVLSEQVKFVPPAVGKPIVAVNGDFYRNDETAYKGDPKGLQIMQGELISAPSDWSCFWIDPTGNPHTTNVTSKFEVVWPNGSVTAIGLNEERLKDQAVLYTTRFGRTTGTTGGRELVLEAGGSSAWLPIQAGEIYA